MRSLEGAELAGHWNLLRSKAARSLSERRANSRYLYELARQRSSAGAGTCWLKCKRSTSRAVRARKTGTGGHLPAAKVTERIAETRGARAPGQDAAFLRRRSTRRDTVSDFRRFADEVRERSGGIPVGFKLSANHIEADIDFALEAGADYIILDGSRRGHRRGAAAVQGVT